MAVFTIAAYVINAALVLLSLIGLIFNRVSKPTGIAGLCCGILMIIILMQAPSLLLNWIGPSPVR
ncbi:hypothetical protein [Paracoccus shandongensis]|uniref:hypothetical protein n=1 Tax=Paracoccus shandongensis TaxID=2816048 RepID=UPI001A8C3904|nr:hypothetical protein [Paracoccus shandongensis]